MLHSTTQLVALDLPLCCTFSLQQGLFFFFTVHLQKPRGSNFWKTGTLQNG